MPKGRPPVPDNVHNIRGTKSRVKKEEGHESPEPEAVLEIPKPPLTLQMDLAQRKWTDTATQLIQAKVLKVTDLDALESYCIAYMNMCVAQKQIDIEGLTVDGAMGGSIKNPACGVLKDAQSELRQMSNLLGLNPSARTRINVGKKEDSKPEGLGGLRKPPRGT